MANYFSHWRKLKQGFRDNSTNTSNTELDNLMINVQKSSLARNKASWRVVPKDSCEIYKDKRKRQMDSDQSDKKNNSSSKHRHIVKSRSDSKKTNYRRTRTSRKGKAIQRQKRNYKRRRLSEESSTYTTDSTADPTNSSTYTTNTSVSYTSDSDCKCKVFNKA